MLDVMLDLETMGNTQQAAIVAIGAVEFDVDAGTIGERFHRAVDLKSSVDAGCTMDPETVLWWLRQEDAARKEVLRIGIPLPEALLDLDEWMGKRGRWNVVRVWGNGVGFDNVILASAYRLTGLPKPWDHRNDRCYRTVKALHPGVKMERIGVHHNAVDDAESQARHLIAMLKAAGSGSPSE